MFDSREIAAYQKISAPASLKEKVLSSCTEERSPKMDRNRVIRRVSSLAACFILVICFSVMAIGAFGSVDVSVSGRALDAGDARTVSSGIAPLGMAGARALSYVDVPIAIDVKGNTDITVSGGMLYVLDGENKEISATVLSGTVYRTDADTSFIWTVGAEAEKKDFTMTVESLFKKEIITLTYDENTGEWGISR